MCLLQNLWKEKFEVAFFVIPGDNEHLFFSFVFLSSQSHPVGLSVS